MILEMNEMSALRTLFRSWSVFSGYFRFHSVFLSSLPSDLLAFNRFPWWRKLSTSVWPLEQNKAHCDWLNCMQPSEVHAHWWFKNMNQMNIVLFTNWEMLEYVPSDDWISHNLHTHTHTQDKEVEFLSFILRLNNVETLLLCGVERHVDM